MKSAYLIVLSLFLLAGMADKGSINYKVIKVNGSIIIKNTGKILERGDIVNLRDSMLFETSNAYAYVVSSTRGRFVLAADHIDLKVAKPSYLPAMSNSIPRSCELNNQLDLLNHFKGNYLIFDSIALKINSVNFPMNDTNYFFIKFFYKDVETFKKLVSRNDTLFILKDSLKTKDGKQISNLKTRLIKLFYHKGKIDQFITDFNPVFADINVIQEVKIIIDELNMPKENKLIEIVSYLESTYGKPNIDNLLEWLKINFKW